MPGKSKLSSYCIVRDSEKLHSLICIKMFQREMGLSEVAKYLGVDVSNVRKYITKKEHTISQQKVLALAAHLNISVDIDIKIVL